MSKRFLITVEYDGRGYCGWQRQKNGVSVQEVLENKLSEILGSAVTLHGSGRTDAGVSAYGQTAHFDSDTGIPADKIPYAVNSRLPKDICVLACAEVSKNFHARFSNKKKTYAYKIYMSEFRRPILDRDRLWIKNPVDVALMRGAAEVLAGRYDCKCFQKSGSPSGDTVKTVYSVDIEELPDGCLDIEITGSGFLYKMARTIAGTLVYAGLKKLSVGDIEDAVKNCDKTKTGKTLSPEYLYLKRTEYTESPF